ncbi:hypothetical protein BRADI_2g13072v3 [Brachypodium distachyon]|uniref:Transposase (putative) gypsy type domain-containing protein n=1 Tax=Brachypodium distachyon TaxID=15368 RepID=A0A0Q3IV38_BRADI|nr:hypothetical protein BRADI_2g13072v3 [Brachypodium distachyon]
MLLAYGLQLHNLPPNSYLHVACFITLCECFLGKVEAVGSVNFQVRPDTKYFSLQQRESVQGWRLKWFYIRSDAPGADPSLLAFSIKKKKKKTAAWSHELTPAEESEATPLMAKMHFLMGQGLTGVHLIALFLRMRIQPLQARVHPMWSFEGPGDPTRVNAEELYLNELESRVQRLTTLIDVTPGKIDSRVVAFGPDRPREKGFEDPLSQPPPAWEEELADESSESPEQASHSETEEVALETRRKRSRESNPKSDDQSTGVEGPSSPPLAAKKTKTGGPAPFRRFGLLGRVTQASSVASGDQPTTQAIEPTGSDPKTSGPSIVVETFEPQPIIRSITEFVDRYDAVTAERDQLRQDLERSQQELRSAQDLLSQANSLKDAAELQSKSLEKKLADLARESKEKLEAEKRLA